MEVAPQFWQNPDGLQAHLRAGERRPAGAARAPSPTTRPTNAPLTVNHQGQFPSVTISFNLPPGVALGTRSMRSIERRSGDRHAGQHPRQLPGHGAGVSGSLANEPILILAALLTVYIVLGVLYESIHPSDHDPLDAAVGGRGRAAGAHALQNGADGDRPHRHHPADRHREEERHPDDRLRPRGGAQGRARARRTPSSKPACCASARSS